MVKRASLILKLAKTTAWRAAMLASKTGCESKRKARCFSQYEGRRGEKGEKG